MNTLTYFLTKTAAYLAGLCLWLTAEERLGLDGWWWMVPSFVLGVGYAFGVDVFARWFAREPVNRSRPGRQQ